MGTLVCSFFYIERLGLGLGLYGGLWLSNFYMSTSYFFRKKRKEKNRKMTRHMIRMV